MARRDRGRLGSMIRIWSMAALVGVGALGCGGPADLILVGGRVWTGTGQEAAAVAVRDGRIAAVGSDAEILAFAGPHTQRVWLNGRSLVPGFMDSHTHFISGGFSLSGVQLRDAATPQEFIRRIAVFAHGHPDAWVTGGAWDHELWGGSLPRREWIDSVTPNTPVLVRRLDAHMALANSVALERAGISARTPDPPGGVIVRDPDGRPTGILKDAAMALVWQILPEPTALEYDRALDAAARYAVERGVTHVTDMGSWEDLETYRRAAAAHRLPLRVYAAVPIATWKRMASFVARHGRGDDWVAWGAVKGFVDGSLGSGTAWFYAPYADDPSTSGMVVTDTAALREQILEADSAGLQVCVHAIGDRANDWVLDVFREARSRNQRADARYRIEHAQHLTPTAITRFKEEGVIASMQPYHAIDDGRWAATRLGEARLQFAYAFRSLLDAGAHVAFGSDWTVAPIEPTYGVYAAVTRRTLDGANPDGWVPKQRITVPEALTAYTRGAAYAAFREDRLGTIEPGKYADLVVLDADPLSIDPVGLSQMRVDITIVNGEVVFRRQQ
jgi:predicted amidohydrolase YtcJ